MLKPLFGRLEYMARYLDKLPPERFDFRHAERYDECGSVGCAIGHTPHIFPKLIKLCAGKRCLVAPPSKVEWVAYTYDAIAIFSLNLDDACGIFTPTCGKRWSENPPNSASTPKEVAAHIRRYIKWKKKELKNATPS